MLFDIEPGDLSPVIDKHRNIFFTICIHTYIYIYIIYITLELYSVRSPRRGEAMMLKLCMCIIGRMRPTFSEQPLVHVSTLLLRFKYFVECPV